MSFHQLQLLTHDGKVDQEYFDKLIALLSQDLDFHSQDSGYASHNFHSFPAKFPPQLPRKFIEELTAPGELVFDPMMGSGTTVLEAFLSGRRGAGFDIDPLALMLTKAKVTSLDARQINQIGSEILKRAALAVEARRGELKQELENRWDPKTRDFVNYWFALETQIELLALTIEIEKIDDVQIRTFFELAFSAIIITKSGGVSLAFDLAHTRPHRAKIVIDRNGEVVLGRGLVGHPSRRVKLLTKTLRSPLHEFEKRILQNLNGLLESESGRIQPYLNGFAKPESTRIEPYIALGNAQRLPLDGESIDLIVTSPPYASNAIDYMRAHKFSLVWMGHSIGDLGQKRKEYIGGEAVTDFDFEALPSGAARVIAKVARRDEKKGRVLHRYYSEMTRTLQEMFRVLRSNKAAIVVVGSSVMRGKNTETHTCLAEIGEQIGFQVPKIGVRNLDRNRRMMPAGFEIDLESQIQQRMYEEYVIGFYKPKV
jgi:DNA modification methylase